MSSQRFDFDIETQHVFDEKFSGLKTINWKNWLEISDSEEFEDLALSLSGLKSVDNLWEKIKTTTTKSRDLSVELVLYIKSQEKSP
ncbi:MAG: hypothetical protein EU550_01675, partial [Promethearchaeota archaeon]